MKHKGKLITFEGISGIGKTYYFNKLKDKIECDNIIFNNEINDQKHKDNNLKIFEILTEKGSRFFDNGNAKLETLLISAKQANDEGMFVIPAINDGKMVISDRGFDTVCIIEGIIFSEQYGLSQEKTIKMLYKDLKDFCLVPDITILFTGDINKSIKRAEKRDEQKYTKKELKILNDSFHWFDRILDNNKQRKTFIINVDDLNENEIIERLINIITN